MDVQAPLEAFAALQSSMNNHNENSSENVYSLDEIAFGFIKVANETMCRPIRNLTQMKGCDLTKHTLACCGGAGLQHACAMAKALGIKRVYVHRFSGILSAYGLSLADIVIEKQSPIGSNELLTSSCRLGPPLEALVEACMEELRGKGFNDDTIKITRYLNLRYEGTDVALMTSVETKEDVITTENHTMNVHLYQKSFIET